MDFGDVIIHIFDKENRLLYDLERIWRDGKMVEKENFQSDKIKEEQKLLFLHIIHTVAVHIKSNQIQSAKTYQTIYDSR